MKIAKLEGSTVVEMTPDHEEARKDAALRQPNSNLARCYLDLVDQVADLHRLVADLRSAIRTAPQGATMQQASCTCGYVPTNTPQHLWSDAEKESAIRHQQFHLKSDRTDGK